MARKSTPTKQAQPSSRSITRTCAILRLLGANGVEGSSLIEVAEATNMPKSSAHRYLLVLESEAFVERDRRTQRYRLGADFVSQEPNHIDRLIRQARPYLENARDKWGETANLGMLVGQFVTYLDIVEAPTAVRLSARKGDKDFIHATALGKAIAANISEKELRLILRRTGMPQRTAKTITQRDKFMVELEKIRHIGYAVDDQENEDEGRCVAVFVPGLSGPVAVSISAIASRLPIEKVPEVADTLREIAENLTLEEVPSIVRT